MYRSPKKLQKQLTMEFVDEVNKAILSDREADLRTFDGLNFIVHKVGSKNHLKSFNGIKIYFSPETDVIYVKLKNDKKLLLTFKNIIIMDIVNVIDTLQYNHIDKDVRELFINTYIKRNNIRL